MTVAEALRSLSIAGSATLTTDSSTKAMVDTRMVATRIQTLRLARQIGSAATDRIAASSHGLAFGLIMTRADQPGLASLELHPRGLDHLVPALDLLAHVGRRRLRRS